MSAAPIVELDDADARARVGVEGLDQTIFVEAGAGSGKTTLLVQRITSLVLDAGVRLSSVAAITFTEAAAAELSSRIRAGFERAEVAALAAGDGLRVERCRQAILDTDLGAITTLHGFANRILGEFAVAASLPPRVRVLDEVSSQLAHEDRWQRFVDRLHDTPEHEPLLVMASVLGIALEPSYPRQSTLRDIAAEFNQNWDRLDPLISDDRGPLVGPSFAAFDDAVNALAEWQLVCTDPSDLLAAHLENVLGEMRAVQAIREPLRKLRQLQARRKDGWGRGRGGGAPAWGDKETVVAVKDAISAVGQSIADTLEPVVHDVLIRLCDLVARETKASAFARRDDGGLEFHDLLVLARNLLRSNDAARRVLHDRFRHVLLDEFQDTDPIQIELAVLIATDAGDVTAVPWHELPVDEGRLFFVGDPKQSIYRFRRADIALFLRARDRFAGPRGTAHLTTNFRTVEPIVRWVNALFHELMPEEIDARQPKYEPLRAARVDGDRDAHRPVLLGGPHPDPKIRAGELREAEAADVVAVVEAIVARPGDWPVADAETGEWREARLDDITILLPTRTSLPFLRGALDAAHVRYRIVTGTLVYDTQEVRDALAALRAIDDPTDQLSLVAALRSPLYACSDVDLTTWRRTGGRWDFRQTPGETQPDIAPDHPVPQAFAHLYALWSDRWFLTPSAMLERLLRERHAAMLAFGDRRPVDVWRRLRFLVEQARAFEEAGSSDLRAFTEWAALQRAPMARVHEPLLPETDETALSIQTIHGAKGLEFPITILSGMTTQFKTAARGASVLWPEVGEPSVRMRSGVETRNHEPRADLEEEMDDYEKKRLAYVAATRARDHLIVSCHHKQGAEQKTYGGLFWTVFDDVANTHLARVFGPSDYVPAAPDTAPAAQLEFPLDDRDDWVRERERLLAPFAAPSVLSATGVATEAAQVALVDQDDSGDDQPEPGRFGQLRRGRTGSAVGSAVHAVLQMLDLADPRDIDDQVAQQCQIEAIPDRTIVVRRLVDAALCSDAVALANRHPHHKELYVAAPLGDQTIEGYIDLLIETPEGLIVVDYKTDSVRSDAEIDDKMAAYEVQAAAYAVALETVTGQSVIECRFVFCRADGAIERSVADLGASKQRVHDTVAALAAAAPAS